MPATLLAHLKALARRQSEQKQRSVSVAALVVDAITAAYGLKGGAAR
jgi:hypothetical protein